MARRVPFVTRIAYTAINAMLATFATLAVVASAGAEPITMPAFPGKCVEVSNQGQDVSQGGGLRLADCSGSPAQDFKFDPATSRLVLHRMSPQLCVDASGEVRSGMGAMARVCGDGPSQRWAFPFDRRLRPVGVDANKCLTHATHPGKPPTGWQVVVEVADAGCEFPEVGGGGFCDPTFAIYHEMMLASCDRSSAQQWTLNQAGMPFPPDGITSRRVVVSVKNMKIDDCREAGACDWRLHCGIGNQADRELINMVERDTGGTIEVNRDLVHEGVMPVTVTCHVREFDRGVLDPDVWEVVGTQTRTFQAAGPHAIQMDNSEGKVTINLVVSPPLGVAQQPLTTPPRAIGLQLAAMQALRQSGVDYSVSEAELTSWLRNPRFTPYPSTAAALVKLLAAKRLRRPVFIDVIVFNYENTPGARSPRRLADVDLSLLATAVVSGHNSRYGETVKELAALLQ